MRLGPIAIVLFACGEAALEPPPPAADPSGLLALPSSGHQIVTEARTIAAGRETTYCWDFVLPDETIDVVRFKTGHAGPMHHFNVFASTLDRPAGFSACPDSIELFTGARPILDGSGADVDIAFPGDVAFRVEPGTRLIFQLHWINATTEPREARFALNLETRPGLVPVLADVYGFSHFGLEIPARSTATFDKDCRIDDPIRLLTMSAHLHRRGVEAKGGVRDADGLREVYRTERWDDPLVASFDPPIPVGVGDALHFECSYDNRDDHVVRYGPRAEDEMCFLFGYYFPARGLLPCL